MAAVTTSVGPLTATQASFICGRPEIFETPLRVKVSTSGLCTKLGRRDAVVRIVQKYFVHDQGEAVLATERIQLSPFVRSLT